MPSGPGRSDPGAQSLDTSAIGSDPGPRPTGPSAQHVHAGPCLQVRSVPLSAGCFPDTAPLPGVGVERPPRLATTLYALLAALQEVVGPEADALRVATVRHLLQSRRLTWLGEARARRCESA